MLPEEIKSEVLSRVAKLRSMEVPTHQIAAAVGLDEAALESLMASEKFKETFSALQLAKYDAHETLNDGWDFVEETAMVHVLTYLKTTNDPEYALKAAAMANKAQRRGGHANVPINGGVHSAAVIQLNAVFVEKLQMMRAGRQANGTTVNANAKRVDALDISSVQALMHKTRNDVAEIFNSNAIEEAVVVNR